MALGTVMAAAAPPPELGLSCLGPVQSDSGLLAEGFCACPNALLSPPLNSQYVWNRGPAFLFRTEIPKLCSRSCPQGIPSANCNISPYHGPGAWRVVFFNTYFADII